MQTNNGFRTLGTMVDCSRNAVLNVGSIKRWIDITSSIGYNMLMLYTEDLYEIEGEPYFGYMRGRYTREELREIDSYAKGKGMTLMPCIQTLAHLLAIKRWPKYGELFDTDDILLAGNERVYELIDKMFASIADSFSCRTVHIGMDEAEMFARGRYYDEHGDSDHFSVLLEHLKRVCSIGEKYGFHFLMWSDMFFKLAAGGSYYDKTADFREDVRKSIPKNVDLVYWDYYSTDKQHYDGMIEAHKRLAEGTWFAGGLWRWAGFAPHNGFSMATVRAAVPSCIENGVKDAFFTMWGDYGGECSPFALLPALFYAAQYAMGNTNEAEIKRLFEERFHIAFDDFMQLDLMGTLGARTDKCCNPDKFMLYNDPFMGLMDKTVSRGDGAKFGMCAQRLEALGDTGEWGYLFKSLGALCRVIETKAELGIKVHEAYTAGDKDALSALLCDFDELAVRLERFHAAYYEQWMHDNKPNGFDVQDIRLGGLIQRVKTCIMRLEAYCEGRLERIEELEEAQLDFFDGSERSKAPQVTNWRMLATVNNI